MEKGLAEILREVRVGLQSLGVGPLSETWSIPLVMPAQPTPPPNVRSNVKREEKGDWLSLRTVVRYGLKTARYPPITIANIPRRASIQI